MTEPKRKPLPAWPRAVRDWRRRRASTRGVVADVCALGGIFLSVVAATFLAATVRHAGTWPVLTVFAAGLAAGFAACVWGARRLERRFAERERGPRILLAGLDGPPLDGESRGFLGRSVRRGIAVLRVTECGFGLLLTAAATAPAAPLAVRLVFGLVGGTILFALVLGVARVAWRGGIEVRWRTETLRPEARAVFYVGTTAGSGRLADAEILLRCVGPRPPGAPQSPRGAPLWERESISGASETPGPDDFVEVTFDLPADAPVSRLDADPPTYWELIVRGRSLWGVVTESFVVPVTARGDAGHGAGSQRPSP